MAETKKTESKFSHGGEPNEQPVSRTFGDFLWGAVTQKHVFYGTLRLIGSLLGIFLLLIAVLWALIRWLQPSISVTVKDSGAVEISTTRTTKTALYLLSSNGGDNSPWLDTGIQLSPGDTVTVTASGKVCLAYHRLIDAAKTDDPPPVPWTGPEGMDDKAVFPPRTYRDEEAQRRNHRLAIDQPQGRLIGIVSADKPSSNPIETAKEDEEGRPLDIGRKRTFTAKRKGTLWLTVNDIWLGPDMKDDYKPQTAEEFKTKIADKHYWNVWYDDNAGSFLVTVEISQ